MFTAASYPSWLAELTEVGAVALGQCLCRLSVETGGGVPESGKKRGRLGGSRRVG